MATTPNRFISPTDPVSYSAAATVAEVAFQAPTNAVTIIPPLDNVNGMRLTSVYGIVRAALGGASVYALYALEGSVYTLIHAVEADDVTPSLTVAPVKTPFPYSEAEPLFLSAGEGLAFSISRNVANGVICRAEGGKY